MSEENQQTDRATTFDAKAVADAHGMPLRWAFFCEFYMQTFNQSKAAKLAGFATPSVDGARLLADTRIRRYLSARMLEARADANEVLGRLTLLARSDVSDFLNAEGEVDIKDAIKKGQTGAIRKIKVTTVAKTNTGEVERKYELELIDPLRPLELIGKHYRLFADVQAKTEDVPAPEELSDAELAHAAREAIERGDIAPEDVSGLVESEPARELREEDEAAETGGAYDVNEGASNE